MPVAQVDKPTRSRDWLVSSYLERLVARLAFHHGLEAADVSDSIQETRIALWRIGLDVPVGVSLVAQIANGKIIDRVRAVARRRAREKTVVAAGEPVAGDAEIRHLLNARVALLSTRLREFYDLRYRQGLSEREIARRWRLSRSSVRWLDQQCRVAIDGRRTSPTEGASKAS